jgi:integrase
VWFNVIGFDYEAVSFIERHILGLNRFKKAFRSAVKEAEIEDFRFHDLRHTFATRAIDSGAPLTGVRDGLGHASLETTNRYAHSTEAGMRRAVEAQEEFLDQASHKSVTKIKRQAR